MESTVPIDDTETMISTTMSMVTNMTRPDPNRRLEILTTLSRIDATTALVVIMFMMGCTIDFGELKESLRRPVGFAIGMVSQFVLMPLIAFCLALALQLETAGALSLLILGCCPGGTFSNIFTYWTDGDVCLSVGMTTVSSTAAIGMMPLNLFIYSRVWTNDSTVIPYIDIAVTLVSICIPALFGVGLRYYRIKWADKLKKICSVFAALLVIAGLPITILINPTFYLAGWGLWIAGVILPLIGYGIGYGFAFLLRQSHRKCRAIAFETGSQNVALASTLTITSFAGTALFIDMLFFPTIYFIFILVDSFLVIIVYRLYVRSHADGELSGSGLDISPSEERDNNSDKRVYVIGVDGGDKTGKGSHGDGNDEIRGVYTKRVELEMDEGNGVMMKSSSIHAENRNGHIDDGEAHYDVHHGNGNNVAGGGGVADSPGYDGGGSSGDGSSGGSGGNGGDCGVD